MKAAGHAIILVSHEPSIITRFCDRALLLEHGRVTQDGPASQVAGAYLTSQHVAPAAAPAAPAVLG